MPIDVHKMVTLERTLNNARDSIRNRIIDSITTTIGTGTVLSKVTKTKVNLEEGTLFVNLNHAFSQSAIEFRLVFVFERDSLPNEIGDISEYFDIIRHIPEESILDQGLTAVVERELSSIIAQISNSFKEHYVAVKGDLAAELYGIPTNKGDK